jgi:site-specific DNA recombinase
VKRSTSKTHDQNSAVLYLRVSTQEQASEGISLQAQEAKLRAYCQMRGLEIIGVICDAGVSGAKPLHTREGGQMIPATIKRGAVAHIVSYKLDRLFRDCADCLTVTKEWDKKNVALHLVDLGGQTLDTSSAMGRFFLTVMAGAAELERNLIAERTTEALGYKKSQGERAGELPYGFQEGPDGKLIEHAGEQATIATIRQYRAEGLSLRAIVVAAAKAGLLSRADKPFQLTQIVRILEKDAA